MPEPFPWTCPYCNRNATITHNINASAQTHFFDNGNNKGFQGIETLVIVCPNPQCREIAIEARLLQAQYTRNPNVASTPTIIEPPFEKWTLRPKSSSRAFPAYIPKAIIDDYNEACLIVNDSPKASATLSRRCLQGMIRDFWGVSKSRLIDEIDGLNGKIDGDTWDAIDAVRGIGNIGAHMEKDISLIVDVEPEEAALLIGLIEFLLEDWYIVRHDREEHKRKVIALGTAKAAARNAVPAIP